MNCKPGDIARVIRDTLPENVNRLVAVQCPCTHFDDEPRWCCEALQSMVAFGVPSMVAIRLPAGTFICIADSVLRPLYDGDGEDEMLRIAGKPADDLALIPASGRVAA